MKSTEPVGSSYAIVLGRVKQRADHYPRAPFPASLQQVGFPGRAVAEAAPSFALLETGKLSSVRLRPKRKPHFSEALVMAGGPGRPTLDLDESRGPALASGYCYPVAASFWADNRILGGHVFLLDLARLCARAAAQ